MDFEQGLVTRGLLPHALVSGVPPEDIPPSHEDTNLRKAVAEAEMRPRGLGGHGTGQAAGLPYACKAEQSAKEKATVTSGPEFGAVHTVMKRPPRD
jgi:hypothetical protein